MDVEKERVLDEIQYLGFVFEQLELILMREMFHDLCVPEHLNR